MSLLIFCCGLCWLAGREECFVGVLECHDFFYSIFTHFYYIYISVIFCHFFITFENYFILLFIYMSIYSLTYFVFSFFELQAFKISMILETWKSGPRFTILFRPIISLSRQIKKKYIYQTFEFQRPTFANIQRCCIGFNIYICFRVCQYFTLLKLF